MNSKGKGVNMKKLLSILLIVAIMGSMSVFAHPFSDVSGNWAEPEIEKAYNNKIINGDPDGKFRPDDIITRAEFVKMLVADICTKAQVAIPSEYDDGTHWASRYNNFGKDVLFSPLNEAVDGVMPGVLEGESYDKPILRWEMAYFISESLLNAAGLTGQGDGIVFADSEAISAYPEIIQAVISNVSELRIMMGDEKNYFNPASKGTRAEAVTVINRIDDLLQGIIDSYIEAENAENAAYEEYVAEVEKNLVTYEEIPKGHPIVTMTLENNKKVKIELYPEFAPQTVANFVKLVKDGFYNGLTFHRIVAGFVAQGGDPNGDGSGNSGNFIKGEFFANGFEGNTLSHTEGVISMARSDLPNSASCQFFVCLGDASYLDGNYAAFGKVISGMDELKKLAEEEMKMNSMGEMATPINPVVIKSMTVTEGK